MTQITKSVTFSLPSEIVDQVDEIAGLEGCTISELLQSAVLNYIKEREWRQLFQHGEQRAEELGIRPEDVESLVDECRAEMSATRVYENRLLR